MLVYTCKHCGSMILWGCKNEYDEHFCDANCYTNYCYSHAYTPDLSKLKYNEPKVE